MDSLPQPELISREEWQAEIQEQHPETVVNGHTILHPESLSPSDKAVLPGLRSLMRIGPQVARVCSPVLDIIEAIPSTEERPNREAITSAIENNDHLMFLLDQWSSRLTARHELLVELWPQLQSDTQALFADFTTKSNLLPALDFASAFEQTPTTVLDPLKQDQNPDDPNIGFYRMQKDLIGIHPILLSAPRLYSELLKTVVHEMIHKVSGGTFWREAPHLRDRVGFSNGRATGNTKTALTEAVTSHITFALTENHEEAETVHPDRRSTNRREYRKERENLAHFLDASQGFVTIRDFCHALFEDSGPNGSTDARRALITSVNQVFRPGTLRDLSTMLSLSPVAARNILEPPVIEEGKVIKKGAINLPAAT